MIFRFTMGSGGGPTTTRVRASLKDKKNTWGTGILLKLSIGVQ